MQKTSRKPPVLAGDDVVTNVVRLPRKSASTLRDDTAPPEEVARLTALMDRVSNAVRQIRYFSLAAKRFTYDELTSSATRAGFILSLNTLSCRRLPSSGELAQQICFSRPHTGTPTGRRSSRNRKGTFSA